MKTRKSFVKVARRILNWEAWKQSLVAEKILFFTILVLAWFKEKNAIWRDEEIACKEGDLIISVELLMEKCCGAFKTEQSLIEALQNLQQREMIQYDYDKDKKCLKGSLLNQENYMPTKGDGNWLKVNRKIIDSAIWSQSKPAYRIVFLTALLLANYEEKNWIWKNSPKQLHPGDRTSSYAEIADKSGLEITPRIARSACGYFAKVKAITIDPWPGHGFYYHINDWNYFTCNDENKGKAEADCGADENKGKAEADGGADENKGKADTAGEVDEKEGKAKTAGEADEKEGKAETTGKADEDKTKSETSIKTDENKHANMDKSSEHSDSDSLIVPEGSNYNVIGMSEDSHSDVIEKSSINNDKKVDKTDKTVKTDNNHNTGKVNVNNREAVVPNNKEDDDLQKSLSCCLTESAEETIRQFKKNTGFESLYCDASANKNQMLDQIQNIVVDILNRPADEKIKVQEEFHTAQHIVEGILYLTRDELTELLKRLLKRYKKCASIEKYVRTSFLNEALSAVNLHEESSGRKENGTPKRTSKRDNTKFNSNFDQRDYDFPKLEAELLKC